MDEGHGGAEVMALPAWQPPPNVLKNTTSFPELDMTPANTGQPHFFPLPPTQHAHNPQGDFAALNDMVVGVFVPPAHQQQAPIHVQHPPSLDSSQAIGHMTPRHMVQPFFPSFVGTPGTATAGGPFPMQMQMMTQCVPSFEPKMVATDDGQPAACQPPPSPHMLQMFDSTAYMPQHFPGEENPLAGQDFKAGRGVPGRKTAAKPGAQLTAQQSKLERRRRQNRESQKRFREKRKLAVAASKAKDGASKKS